MEPELVTVFRSADPSAKAQAAAVCDLLAGAGLPAQLFGDDAPGVPSGAVEVRVPASQVSRAEELIAAGRSEISEPGDASHDMDLVTVFTSDVHNSEMEAFAVQGMLEGSGIPSVIVGASVYPNLPFEVRVPKSQLEVARQLIAESQVAGPEAAEQAEKAAEAESSESAE